MEGILWPSRFCDHTRGGDKQAGGIPELGGLVWVEGLCIREETRPGRHGQADRPRALAGWAGRGS